MSNNLICSLIKYEEKCISYIKNANNFSRALYMASLLGSIKQNRNNGSYNAIDLEKHLYLIFKKSYQTLHQPILDKAASKLEYAHVITTPLTSGGHTRLCLKLSTYHEKEPDLVVTQAGSSTSKENWTSFKNIHFVDGEIGGIEYFNNLVNILSNYKNIVLYLNPNDIYTVVAIKFVKEQSGINVIFVNHSDHTFYYGETIIDTKLEISWRGYLLNEKRGGVYASSYIGLPVDFDNIKPKKSNLNECTKFIMVGSRWKMKPREGNSVGLIVKKILGDSPENTLTVVGADGITDYWWWKYKIRYGQRLLLKKRMSYERYLKLLSYSEASVDTHPVPGGLTLVEMFVNGLLPCGLKTGITGFSSTDAVKVKDIKNLFDVEINSLLVESTYNLHSDKKVKERFNKTLEHEYYEIPEVLKSNGNPDVDFFLVKKRPTITKYDLNFFMQCGLVSRIGLLLQSFILFRKVTFIPAIVKFALKG